MEMIKLKAPEGCGSVSFGGEEYKVDKKGFVSVPQVAAADLAAHGFVVEVKNEAENA